MQNRQANSTYKLDMQTRHTNSTCKPTCKFDMQTNMQNQNTNSTCEFDMQTRRTISTYKFRYMRRKPTIIALDLPSPEECPEGEEEEEDATPPGSNAKDEHILGIEEGRRHTGAGGPTSGRSGATPRRMSRQEVVKEQRERRQSRLQEITLEGGCAVGKPLVVYVDGPFGAPSSHIFRAHHAVLIGTGIGSRPSHPSCSPSCTSTGRRGRRAPSAPTRGPPTSPRAS